MSGFSLLTPDRRARLQAYGSRFRANATRRKNCDDAVARAGDAGGLKKARAKARSWDVLGAFDLVLLGIGGIIGAGVFVLTGVAARNEAGPAVIFSYMLSAFASFLAALCYTEFAVELPVAGSAYNYIAVTFGELPAFLVGCDLVLEYSISAAAVSRGWTSYAATLVDLKSDAFRINAGAASLDPLAACLVAAQCGVLCLGIKESSNFNIAVNAVMFLCIAFVLLAGASQVEKKNYTPFAPFGVSGIFSGASIVFFSFIGFDTVATAAEEVRNPGRDLPLGIIGSLGICTVLYAAMCAVITGMVPYTEIDLEAPFAVAFKTRGMEWASVIVSAGALTGITTSLLVSLLGQPRIYMTMSRDGLLPPWFSVVHPKRGTPVHATIVTGLTAGTMAFFVDIDALAQLVSIGTLCVFCFVCAAVLGRRYLPPSDAVARSPILSRIGGLAASALACSFTVELTKGHGGMWLLALPFLGYFCYLTHSLSKFPVVTRPKRFAVPAQPYIPAAGMFATVWLISSLGPIAWARFVIYYAICGTVYALYRGGIDPAVAVAQAEAAAASARAANSVSNGGGGPHGTLGPFDDSEGGGAAAGYEKAGAVEMGVMVVSGGGGPNTRGRGLLEEGVAKRGSSPKATSPAAEEEKRGLLAAAG